MPRTVATELMFEGKAEEAMNLYVSLFEGKAEEAMNLYVSLFEGAVTAIERYGPGAEGSVKRVEFTLAGHRLACIDSPAKHAFTFTPSASLFVDCNDEAELDAALDRASPVKACAHPNHGRAMSYATDPSHGCSAGPTSARNDFLS